MTRVPAKAGKEEDEKKGPYNMAKIIINESSGRTWVKLNRAQYQTSKADFMLALLIFGVLLISLALAVKVFFLG